VNNHRQITNRWLQLSRIEADVKKHNACLESLRARSRDYAALLHTSSHTAVTLRERVRSALVAIEGIESSARTRDTERMKSYLHFLNQVAANATQEAEVITKRQEQLRADISSDAQATARGAHRSHTRSSLFAISALGALPTGVALTVRLAAWPQLFRSLLGCITLIRSAWYQGGAVLLVGGPLITLTAIAGGGTFTGLTCGALLDASDGMPLHCLPHGSLELNAFSPVPPANCSPRED
jgi:uncharacterized membrane protein